MTVWAAMAGGAIGVWLALVFAYSRLRRTVRSNPGAILHTMLQLVRQQPSARVFVPHAETGEPFPIRSEDFVEALFGELKMARSKRKKPKPFQPGGSEDSAASTKCTACELWWYPPIHGPRIGEPCPDCGRPVVAFGHIPVSGSVCPDCKQFVGQPPGMPCPDCGKATRGEL